MKRKHRPPQSATVRHPPAELGQQAAAQPLQPDVDTRRLLHELQVHQVELELQNEELRQTREQLQTALEHQTELYDFAPVSYLTLGADGVIRKANLTAACLFGVDRSQMLGRCLGEFAAAEDRSAFNALLLRAFQTKGPEIAELRLSMPGKPTITVKISACAAADGRECRVVLEDLTERVRLEQERELIIQLLNRINSTTNLHELMREATRLLRDSTGCEAVGIRLQEGDDFPYFVTTGFPAAFVLAERCLCATDRQGQLRRDTQGRPILECICGDVIRARYDPTQPFFTANGSFWTNSTTQLLNCTPVTDLPTVTRNRCHGEGYESVALVPLRNCGHTFGLLQFNDRRPDRFTPALIAHLEHLADHLTVALARCQEMEARKQSESQYQSLVESMIQGVFLQRADGVLLDVNPAALKIFGVARRQFLCRTSLSPDWDVVNEDGSPCLGENHPSMQALRTGKAVNDVVLGVLNFTTQTRVWLEINAIPEFRAGEEKPYQVAVTLHDITTRKAVEEELRQSRQRLELAQRLAGAGIWDWDIATGTFNWSQELFSLFGLDPTRALAGFKSWGQVVHPEDREAASGRIEQAVQDGKPLASEYRVLLPDGTVRWIHALGDTVYDPTGHPLHMSGICLDITERKRAEEALRQSEERYRRLFETESDAILLLDCATGRVEDVNEAAVRLYGYSRKELLSLKDVDLSAEAQETRNAILTQQTMVPHRLHRKMDGTVFPVEIVAGYFDSSGRKMYVAAIRDITKRKRVEDELRKLSLAVEQSPASVVLTDLLGNIEYVNPRYCRITGYTAEEARGKNPRILKSGKMPAETYQNLWAKIVAGKEWDGELLNQKKNGELFWERAIISPVKDSQGRTTHYLAIKEDITERKRSEEELRSSREQLRALGFALARAEHQERRRIASLLHDDVIQSLALVQIKLGALRAQLGSCEQQNLLDTLRTHLDQAIGSTRRMTFQISPPILHELGLEAALSWLAEQMKEQHRLGCECVTESVRTILEEETSSLLFAATRELLLNVVKHARASKAHIATHSDSSLFRITVEDNGMGFDPATLSPASGKTRGFGLLNIRERLGYLGGECVIHSLPGHGTRVVLTIPIKRE